MQGKIVERIQQINALEPEERMKAVNELKSELLGKRGEIVQARQQLKDALPEDKPILGQLINKIITAINEAIEETKQYVETCQLEERLKKETIDISLPGREVRMGTKHILTRVLEDLEDLFISMGYQVVEGPEVEVDLYNFGKMNLPKEHPARDMQDTFYISSEVLLRTQTSPVQARTMEKHDFSKGPLKMISPGKVYRRDDDDATHSHQFQQIEGLVIDKHITMGDLKGTLEVIAKYMFGEERSIRLRPSYFPFTEPSVEVDVSCFKCSGQGCSVCKKTGWIEVLGAGMVHPNVLEMSGVDSTQYSGFAFGLGLERFTMLKYGVDDIRHFYQNDVRFLNQFKTLLEGEA
ncbi:phenylalanine--tRNA ligase subunit alpha [Granulicatella sp. WM01]|nr:phenylalanine--tRNA ligase subunit alpha [Granulicatella sp. WM01]